MPSIDSMFMEALDQRSLVKIKSLVDEWHYELPINKMEKLESPTLGQEWRIIYTYNGKPDYASVLSTKFKKSAELIDYFVKYMRKHKIKNLN